MKGAQRDAARRFDIRGLTPDSTEDKEGVLEAVEQVERLVQGEIDDGVPSERILVGGFSQGGATALSTGLRSKRRFAGVIALSAWLPLRNYYPQELGEGFPQRVFQAHGKEDPIVPFEFGQLTKERVNQLGGVVEFNAYDGMGHEGSQEELRDLEKFCLTVLPENDGRGEGNDQPEKPPEEMSIKDLKQFVQARGSRTDDCLEKNDLIQRARSLMG